jgi:hypothetical protein
MMMLYAVVALAFAVDQHRNPGLLAIAVSLSLIAGGVLLLLRKPGGYYVALGAGLFTLAAGLASMKLPVGVALPVQPVVPIVIGLYVCLRVAIVRRSLLPGGPSVPGAEVHGDDTAG